MGREKMLYGPNSNFDFIKIRNNTSSWYIVGTNTPKQMGNWRSRPIQISFLLKHETIPHHGTLWVPIPPNRWGTGVPAQFKFRFYLNMEQYLIPVLLWRGVIGNPSFLL